MYSYTRYEIDLKNDANLFIMFIALFIANNITYGPMRFPKVFF